MDEMTGLLVRARTAGLRVSATGDKIVIQGPRSADALARELLAHKSAIFEHLRRQPNAEVRRYCRACICDDAIGGGASCAACKGRTCRDCGGCLRASMLWREAELYSKYLDIRLDAVLQQLREGSQWLREEMQRGTDDTELFLERFTTWAELEEVLRAVHGFAGCIYGTGESCPEDAPVTCSACL